MNNGAFGENFPYSNFHDLNMDWIIKIAKDFLDQYTNIQQTITDGLEGLDNKAQELEALLQEWYDTHSEDIATQLADALEDLNNWYSTHEGYLNQYVTDSISAFNQAADAKAASTIESIPSDYTKLSTDVEYVKNILGMNFHSTTGYIDTFGIVRPGPARFYTDFIPCAELSSVEYVSENNHSNICGIAFYDINKNFISGYSDNGTIGEPITVTSPAHTAFCRISTRESILADSYVKTENGSLAAIMKNVSMRTCFISPTGDDTTGTGSLSSPYKTINKALAEGAANINLLAGRYYQTIDLSNRLHNDIMISAYDKTGRAILMHPDAFVSDSETKTSGYTKIYQCTYTGSIRTDIRLYQEDVPDTTTRIPDAEQNAYQQGRAYRCLDTKILPCTATTLSEALQEIENSTSFKYYYDSANSTVYFSRPEPITTTRPLMRSVHAVLMFNNPSRDIHLKLTGIIVKYTRFNLNDMVVELTDCTAANVFGTGGFIYDGAIAKFTRCEASGIYYGGGGGDGFNAHSVTTGEPWAKQTTGLLIDCWSHDCMDDGFSDHERCESELHGGLFEYNGKAGVTPSYGTHCACYNVLSRRNTDGFWYLGVVTPEEQGKGGQLLCIACVAEENHNNNNGCGFSVTGEGNLIELINCKAIGNDIGYSSGNDTIIKLIDCGSRNNTTAQALRGLSYINNTTIIN